jgi:hypothetical protein
MTENQEKPADVMDQEPCMGPMDVVLDILFGKECNKKAPRTRGQARAAIARDTEALEKMQLSTPETKDYLMECLKCAADIMERARHAR